MSGITIWPASRLGPQLHCNAVAPARMYFERPRMRTQWERHFVYNQPDGGCYTANLEYGPYGPTSAYLETVWLCEPRAVRDRRAYILTPEPEARVAVIDGPADVEAVLEQYRYPRSGEFNYPAMLADGIAAVYLTERAARGAPSMWYWMCAQTLWLRWAFAGEPYELASPLVIPQEPERTVTHPYYFYGMPGAYRDWWFVTGPVDTLGRATLEWLHDCVDTAGHNPQYFDGNRERFYAGVATLLGAITEHNFPDGRGGLLPTGPALVPALVAAPPIGPHGVEVFLGAVLKAWWWGATTERLMRPVLPAPPAEVAALELVGAPA